MKKIITIIGARPQFIKAAAVSRLLAQHDDITELLVHTGQHYDHNMSDQFFEELEIPTVAYHLNIGSSSHGKQTADMLIAIEEILLKEKPDWVLVYGDTNSTLAGALAAAKLHIPIAHVEAGLRSFNRRMPEEINRVLTDSLSTLLFVPTSQGVINLKNEGISKESIHQVGDVMFDAALYFGEQALNKSSILDTLTLDAKNFLLATIHRAENTDDKQRLKAIVDSFCELSEQYRIVLPLHPRTEKYLRQYDYYNTLKKHVDIIEPVGFLDMVCLEKTAKLILTDSGGVQKEAFFHGVPCITLRDETEWVELVELDWNTVCSPRTKDNIIETVRTVLKAGPGKSAQPYGDGQSCRAIIDIINKA